MSEEPQSDRKEETPQPVRLPEDELNYEMIKSAIYFQMQLLFEHGVRASLLKLSPDIYEILNKRLVFKTPAHKDLAHFITPHGNLRVVNDANVVKEPRSFLIE